jgi:hypothetical protein
VNHELGIRVTRSVDGDASWADPVHLRSTVARGDNHWVVFDEPPRTRVGLAVTEDGGDVLFLSIDQDDDFWADSRRRRDESDLIPGHAGTERVDDELSAVSVGGEVFIVVETELGPTSRSDGVGLPQLVVYHRTLDGSWFKRVLTEYGAVPGEDLKRPTIAANRDTGDLYVGPIGRPVAVQHAPAPSTRRYRYGTPGDGRRAGFRKGVASGVDGRRFPAAGGYEF